MKRGAMAPLEQLASGWISEVKRRRQFTAVDPVADTLEYCAGELNERIRLASFAQAEVTVDQFAELHRVLPATVRRWCRQNRLGARLTPGGYVIPADAIPPLRRAS